MKTIDGQKWKELLNSGVQVLEQQKKDIDLLNVFPVPDGDTGTNMYLTFKAAASAAEKANNNSISDVANAASMGSLMGARGNSGVILSQIMRGIFKGLEGLAEANAKQLAHALQNGSETAYKAVMKPVEGTILTVAKEVAKGAVHSSKSGEKDIITVLKAAYDKGQEILKKTPDMLPALKQAGVVDAGGQGYLVIIGSFISALEGKINLVQVADSDEKSIETKKGISMVGELEYPYCTEFLVKGAGISIDAIKRDLGQKGDCFLVVGTEEVVKIHIHSKNPGGILDYAIKWGSLHEVKIHNMLDQNEAMSHSSNEPGENSDTGIANVDIEKTEIQSVNTEFKEYGLVAVAMGDGIAEIFKSLGVDQIVFGGQTMNPSTNDLAEAVSKVQAKNVFILPNNKNITMAARQVNEVVDNKQVCVIPTSSIPQGISAILGFNPDLTLEENEKSMSEAVSLVMSGDVTYAVRNSQYGELNIAEGDILGLVEGKIVTTARDIIQVTKEVLEKMDWRKKDLVTAFYGQDVAEEDAEALRDWLESENPDIEVEIHAGKQPLYYYILGVE